MFRLSRPCYDKPHRCPGWAGGGAYMAKEQRCDGGSIRTRHPYPGIPGEFQYPGAKKWSFGHCNQCNVVTIPFAWTRFAPARVRWRIEAKIRNWKYRRNWR